MLRRSFGARLPRSISGPREWSGDVDRRRLAMSPFVRLHGSSAHRVVSPILFTSSQKTRPSSSSSSLPLPLVLSTPSLTRTAVKTGQIFRPSSSFATLSSSPSSSSPASEEPSVPRPPQHRPWNVLFFGTDNFSLKTLERLWESSLQSSVSAVATDVDRAVRVGLEVEGVPPVVGALELVCPPDTGITVSATREFARRHNIPVHQPAKLGKWRVPHPRNAQAYGNRGFDVAVVASYGKFIPAAVLAQFERGGINLHPSLLPEYRGAAPIHHALMNGDTRTGISVIEVHPKKWDAGRVFIQIPYHIRTNHTIANLTEELAETGSFAVVDVLRDLDHKMEVSLSQEELLKDRRRDVEPRRAPKITQEQGWVSFDSYSAHDVYCHWRALGSFGGIHVLFGDKRVKLLHLVPSPNQLLTALPDFGVSNRMAQLRREVREQIERMKKNRCDEGNGNGDGSDGSDRRVRPGSLLYDKPKKILWAPSIHRVSTFVPHVYTFTYSKLG
eukprot:TRINITY_DN3868_c0_g1_i3.p1 TRINITY_DN3868_c0_g1~~TRINITY_DN3868_c0_g1_i3.p1  ORF type:complete len:500 (+),score=78.07 TRINITY_DN3868_c0_g1_i3:264-1763(+)